MKTIILALCFIATNAFCQSPLTEWALKFYAGVPPLNREIIHEVDKLIDKKVGKGLCGEFVNSVLSNIGLKIPKLKKTQVYIDEHWEKLPDNTAIYPGDIIIYGNHIAIIYAKLSPLEYTLIEQNFSGRRKYSHVGFSEIKFENVWTTINEGWATIYRITL